MATFTITADDLASVLHNALLAVSKDKTIPLLGAVKIDVSGETLTTTATDRYQLVEAYAPIGDAEGDVSLLLSGDDAKTILAAVKPHAKACSAVHVEYTDGKLTVSHPAGTVAALGMEGDYPKVRSLFRDATVTDSPNIVGINPTLLANVGKLKTFTPRDEVSGVIIGADKTGQPWRFMLSDESGQTLARYIIMPTRLESPAEVAAQWNNAEHGGRAASEAVAA